MLPIGTADRECGFSTMKPNEKNHCMHISMEGQPLDKFDFDTAVKTWSLLKKLKNRVNVHFAMSLTLQVKTALVM